MNDDEMEVIRTRRLTLHQFGPKDPAHSSVGKPCPACGTPFVAGDYTTLVTFGPGGSLEARERARKGRPYDAIGVEVHWACATGEES